MSTSTTSTGMRRGTGEDSPDVLSEGFAVHSRSRILAGEKVEKAHSEGAPHIRSHTADADSGSQNQSWLSYNQRAKVTVKVLQGKASEERATQETGTGRL